MLQINHVGDYLLQKDGQDYGICLNVAGHRRLNHSVKMPLNLNQGYRGQITELDEEHRTLEVLLKWMIAKEPEGDLSKIINSSEVIARRGILARMAAGDQLKDKGNWKIICEKRNGLLFIEEEPTEERKKYIRNMSEAEKRATYMGHRFEEYMILPSEDRADLRMAIIGTIKGADGKEVRALYSGEVDAIDKDGKYVEMKTQKKQIGGYWFWKEKSLKWWLQSKLVGIGYLLVGIKDNAGYVRKLEKLSLDSLENSNWNGEKCIEFLVEALGYCKQNVPEGASRRIACENGQLKCYPSDHNIITEEFQKHFKLT